MYRSSSRPISKYNYSKEKLLIANRGEIAVRIIRTAKKLGLRTLAVYGPSDATAEHVRIADEAVSLPAPSEGESKSEGHAYLSPKNFLDISKAHNVTLIHPGYGFLSESAEFAELVAASGVTWLGPSAEVIRSMGTKHDARRIAKSAEVPIVPGSDGLVTNVHEAVHAARRVGYPVILKATAGGGGMGMVVCHNEKELREKLASSSERAKVLFGNEGVFLERYFDKARHIEIQVFGNGLGDVVHMAERECSVQRRHQKVVEESPSPFLHNHPGVREAMCDAAVQLCQSLKYGSAGTIEFIVDDHTGDFFFLEMNTRIQVEHPVTEAIHPGLDLIQLMIEQGMEERLGNGGLDDSSEKMSQDFYDDLRWEHALHAIEGRVYAENPAEGFIPSPGLLQHVELQSDKYDWLRVDSWVESGARVTPHYDPLLCKVIVTGATRDEAMERFVRAMDECKVLGPPNNADYLKAIVHSDVFRRGAATTQFLDHFSYTPKAFKVLSAGIDTSIQDLPGRTIGFGIPRSGPMDPLALRAANILVGNSENTEGLEVVIAPGVDFSILVHATTVIAVTGKRVLVSVNDTPKKMWSTLVVPAGGTLNIEDVQEGEPGGGFRVYIAFKRGFPSIPSYLGSKSTSMGLGGYQGRSLMPGDQIDVHDCQRENIHAMSIPATVTPNYPRHWTVYVLSGPHDNEEFLTSEGITSFYETHWRVSPSSNRLGMRLESDIKIQWARSSGGEGGSHPSNILDNGYAPGTINVNGNTPVILTNEGPDMGGYLCLCTIATGDMWKLGQIAPGNTIQFRRITWDSAMHLRVAGNQWLKDAVGGAKLPLSIDKPLTVNDNVTQFSPVLAVVNSAPDSAKAKVVFRQAGDSGVLVEFGDMNLDLFSRARIHAFEQIVHSKGNPGTRSLCPCIRSVLCLYDPLKVSQTDFLNILLSAERELPDSFMQMEFKIRKITFPIVLDDHWNRDALERYMRSTRDKAVYLPSNVEYLARNNGLSGKEEALQKLVGCDWIVLGVGFYLACPFLVPLDPRCQLVGQKMNPSRTYTPRGAIGIAGPVAAIYPIESPGGYQLYGRTLPTWLERGNEDRPWVLQSFDQVHFEVISESEYVKVEQLFDSGTYKFQVKEETFSLSQYGAFLDSIAEEAEEFRQRKKEASAKEEDNEAKLLAQWEGEKKKAEEEGALLNESTEVTSSTVTAPLFASIWKITCSQGQVIESAEDVLFILEAMKTEIPVKAGKRNVGKSIRSFGKGIKPGGVVQPGNVLVYLV